MRALIGCFALGLLASACSSNDMLSPTSDAAGNPNGTLDAGVVQDGAAPADAADASGTGDGAVHPDGGGLPSDGGPLGADSGLACDPLAVSTSTTHTAALTGRIDLIDYDSWEDQPPPARRGRVRNAGFNFLTQSMTALPPIDAVLFTGIPIDSCITVEIPNPMTPLGPPRNIGVDLLLSDGAGLMVRLVRGVDSMGAPSYDFASQADTNHFFDKSITPLDHSWTWSTSGDPAAGIHSFSAKVNPVEDFEVTPPITTSSAALPLDPVNGTTLHWTAPRNTPGVFSITLDRALNANGDGRYVVCRVTDDGAFTIPGAAIASLGATPGLPFGLEVVREAAGAFCNEGVVAGAAVHALAYLGLGVIP